MANPTDVKEDIAGDELDTIDDFVQIYMLNIDVNGACNLEKADTFGKSDPYVKVSALSRSYTTCTIKKSLNPTWNESVEMVFLNDPKTIHFAVFDWDGKLGGKDDSIGECTFDLTADVYSNANDGFKGKIQLQNCKSGELEIGIYARKLLPLELEKQLSTLQETMAQNQNTLTTQETEMKDMRHKNETFKNEISQNETLNKGLKEDIPKSVNEKKQMIALSEKCEAEMKDINTENDSLEKKYKDLENRANEVISELGKVIGSKYKKEAECRQLQQSISDLVQQIKDKKKSVGTEEKAKESNGNGVSHKKGLNTQSEVYSNTFMESDYEKPTYGLLENEKKNNEIEVVHVKDTDKNCCIIL